ncbi:NEQ348 [Nanoarchaeum equitans Kin4-M]|uniref:NEQ348 n=1 Tax=Nanoarchaeum equitans (strain Kin4-M) TaxID=228908 RepID=Q74NJ9_NANEQ|nr:NEQ348 [Nanoarchaeum equitans Kin4-M]
MAKRKYPFPVAPLYRIMRQAGAKRVTKDAKEAFVEVAVEIAKRVARRAAELAKHAKRVTVKEQDVRLALEELRGL